MTGGIADIFQVIMLAPGPHTALRSSGPQIIPLLLPGKKPFKLHHAGIGKKQGGIILGHQG